jgi:hypothetical protein
MPTGSFSHTAPRVTDEQEAAERLGLSHEERQKVIKDLFGGDPNSLPAEEQRLPELVARMARAVELIDDSEKSDYLRALKLCPALVASESDAVRFLRSEEYDPEVGEWYQCWSFVMTGVVVFPISHYLIVYQVALREPTYALISVVVKYVTDLLKNNRKQQDAL